MEAIKSKDYMKAHELHRKIKKIEIQAIKPEGNCTTQHLSKQKQFKSYQQ